MALTVKDNTKVGVEIEVTEGTYVAPAAATSFVQTLSDGFELTPAKELLERAIFNGSIGKTTPRTGTRTVSGSIPVECRAAETEGDAPEYDKLMRSAMGSRKQITSEVTTKTGNSASVLQIQDADIGEFEVNDIILVKEAGAYWVSPITAVDPTGGAANITLLMAAGAPFSDNVVIAKSTMYKPADSGHPSLSISKYVEDARREVAVGARVNSLSLDNFTTGQLASWGFGFEGLDFDTTLSAIPFTPDFQDSLPPVILNACLFQDGVDIAVNELTISLENTLGFATSTCSENGRISGRATERNVTGSFNPYKQDDDIDNFTKFKTNTEYSLFAFAYNPTGVAGEYEQIVAVYMPKCLTTELGESDQDGLLVEDISFTAGRGSDGSDDELVIAFI